MQSPSSSIPPLHISEINDPRKQDCKNLILEEDQELQSKLEEIGEAITQVIQLAADKAIPKVKLGPDAITQDIITATFKFNPEILFIAYSILFNYGYHPRCWKAATGAILKKPSKLDYSLPKAYRVITLLNSLGKVLERIIAKRLASLAETTNLLHSSQIRGRNKKSAIDAALLLVDQIQHKKQQGQITSTVFVDVKGAFDHVIHNRFLDRLKKLRLPISLICWAKSFLSNRTLRLAFDNKIEEFSKIRAGIPQGSLVSPIFFLIYIRDLFPALQSFQLSYINDLSLTTSSTSLKKNIRALQKEIATLFAKGEQLDIIFDTSKTELIHFTAKKERIKRALILPNNDRIEHKDTVKWLGIYLDNRLSFKSHVSIRLVYNGELEGITRAFEYAAKNATTDQEFKVYADNQAVIYRLKNLLDNLGQHWQL
ncbi:hypothetical protein PtrM4_145980 [Pyrenophora tritici-repentis]|uniref:Reverse transcriptase domain-containing protein n=1 Tax=Pyrenophora tritici-repentis TaxID=45151 RepID=A0A834RLZ5_9PLEO|nr:hypothetical protein PtrM4_145980 [Pyrenophora tritici-repentis]